MQKALFTTVFALFLSLNLAAQAPGIEWSKSLGGWLDEWGRTIVHTQDGGYAVCGYTNSTGGGVVGLHGDYDIWVTKIDASGALQWQKALGGSLAEDAYGIQQAPDQGFYVFGQAESLDGDVTGVHTVFDYWLTKIDSLGVLQWQKCFGGHLLDYGRGFSPTPDGGFYMAGYSTSNNGDVTGNHGMEDYWVLKVDSALNILWQKSLGGSQRDELSHVTATLDGGCIATGYTQSSNGDVTGYHGGSDLWLTKLSATGVLQWQKALGGTVGDIGTSVLVNADSSFTLFGYSFSSDGDVAANNGDADYWIVKIDSLGTILWEKNYGGSGEDYGQRINHTDDGGYIAIGKSTSNDFDVSGNHGGADYWVIKVDSVGNLEWQKSLGGSGYDWGQDIFPTADGYYIMVGGSNSIDGDITDHVLGYDFWIVKMGLPADQSPLIGATWTIYPNPASQQLHVRGLLPDSHLSLLNTMGQVVIQKSAADSAFDLDLSMLAKGTYFLCVEQDGQRTLKPIIVD